MLEAALEQEQDPLIGRVLLGRYRVLSVLGEGGMGRVYLADQKMGAATRKVAIKTLHPELSGDPQLIARFHRESETVIELSHPNTIQFYDFGELDDGALIIVMEYIEGESLASILERGALEPGRVDRLLIQICGSLHEAHQRGIVHRDLKPENVLLTERGGHRDFVKVLDFGIAKRSEAEGNPGGGPKPRLTTKGMVLGTPPYMSPEQFSGQALDARSDIYSLGVMAYEMLTGRLPFEANTPWEWATKHLMAEPIPFDAQSPPWPIPERKKAAVMRALAKSRDQRQASAIAFLSDFTGFEEIPTPWAVGTLQASREESARHSTSAASSPSQTPRQAPPVSGMRASFSVESGAAGGRESALSRPSVGGRASRSQADPYSATAVVESADVIRPPMRRLPTLAFVLAAVGLTTGGFALWKTQTKAPAEVANPRVDEEVKPEFRGPASEPTPEAEKPDQDGTPKAVDAKKEETRAPRERPETKEKEGERSGRRPSRTRPAREEKAQGDPAPSDTPSTRDQAGLAALQQFEAALSQNDLDSALNSLEAAERSLGGRDPQLREARRSIAKKAENKVGILVQQGKCADAQALFKRLRAASAAGNAAAQFSSEWCPAPN